MSQLNNAPPAKIKEANKSHVSFSALKNWNTCPYYHKLVNIEKIKIFQGNEYTAFGTAIHDTCEKKLLQENIEDASYFSHRFKEILNELDKEVELKPSLVDEMLFQGPDILPHVIPTLDQYFGNYRVISTEEELYEPIAEFEYYFKGYIDLVLQTEDGKYHIIDWKTCSWGWDSRRRAEKMTTYQLVFYKHFWAQKHNIDPTEIEIHFALLKRTAKQQKVELFRVTSGSRKTQNAINLLNKALYNIISKNYIKNRLACKSRWGYCEFYKTKHCV